MQLTRWRLIISAPARGAWNMAVDEAILESVMNREALPTLRLYAWDPACLSLGLAQPVSDVDLNELAKLGWDLVRRPTGGRAILHVDELTYSVTAPSDEPRVVGGVLDSYQRLSQALLAALQDLHLEARADKEYTPSPDTTPNGAVCFEVPSNYEITVNGKKLIGSAQARRKDGLLQHGSLPLCGDLTRITRVLKYPDDKSRELAGQRLLSHAINVEMLGKQIDWETAVGSFQNAFADSLHLQLEEDDLSSTELRRAMDLLGQKYQNPSWTFRL